MLLSGIARPQYAMIRGISAAWRSSYAARSRATVEKSSTINAIDKSNPRTFVSTTCCRAANHLPDVCGLPVVTSSWEAIKRLDEAYAEVSAFKRLWPDIFVWGAYIVVRHFFGMEGRLRSGLWIRMPFTGCVLFVFCLCYGVAYPLDRYIDFIGLI